MKHYSLSLHALFVTSVLLCWLVSTSVVAGGTNADNTWQAQEILITIHAKKQDQPQAVYGNPNNYRNQRRNQYAVKLDNEILINDIAERYELKRIKGWPIKPLSVYCEVFAIPKDTNVQKLLAIMNEDNDIESVQLLNQFSAQSGQGSYNDPYLSLQHNLVDLNVLGSHIHTNGNGIKIAIVDSKIDSKHTELRDSVDQHQDFIGNRKTAEKHGTAIAGLIAAAGNNDLGIVGIAPGASLLGLRACEHQQSSSQTVCNTFTLAQALTHAIEEQVNIINLSLTGPEDPLLARLIRKASENNIAVVAAAGDNSFEANFPASMPEVIAVQVSGRDDARSVIFAPGTDLLTTTPDNGFDFVTGSSFAAAQVSGLLALLLETSPGMLPAHAKDMLIHASEDGYLNACSLLNDDLTAEQCNSSNNTVAP